MILNSIIDKIANTNKDDEKLNIVANITIHANKRQNTVISKQLNIITNKVINTNKNQITKWTELEI